MKSKRKFHTSLIVSTILILLLILVSSTASAGTAQSVSPVKTYAYITTSGDNTVSVIDTETNTVIVTVPVGQEPWGVAAASDGKKVYVTNRGSNTVSVIDTATNTVTATIPVGGGPMGVAVNPEGTRYMWRTEAAGMSL